MSLAWTTFVRLLIVPAVLVALAAATATAQPAPPASTPGEALFVVSGRGWGHGVGMSQYGAYGMATAGHTYDEILAHYYTGTVLGPAGRKIVRVLLAEGRRASVVSSTVPFTMVDGTGAVYRFQRGSLTLEPNAVVPTSTGPTKAVPPLVFRPGKKAPLAHDGKPYRGKLEVALEGGFQRIVNVLPLESYLEGVIANEMPHTWPLEALKAQAVAARSYALASLVKGKPFDLYSDVRSQVYRGAAGEQPRTSEAVRATAYEVVFYGGKVATTYYFSTSGGKTASAADVFGFDVPYLVSRPDPWDEVSPHHTWGPVLIGARTLQSKLGLDARVLDAVGVATPSGRLRSLTLQTAAGPSKLPAALLRTSLGLRSTWVTFGALRLDDPNETPVFGSTLRLTGIARGLPLPTLASSPTGSTWSTVGPLQRQTSGVASIVVRPDRTQRYRIEVEGAASPALLLQVAPRVLLAQPIDLTSLGGTVRPRLSGASVTIERARGSAWRPVRKTTVDRAGAFRVQLQVTPGTYRARVAATDGFAEGVAPIVEVTG